MAQMEETETYKTEASEAKDKRWQDLCETLNKDA